MQNFIIVRKSSSVYLAEDGVLSLGYPSSSRSLCLAERGGAFLREQKPVDINVVTAERGLVLSN